MALFGEKYDDPVRVLSIGDYSTELCGGTHVQRAGDIGLFKIVSETGVAAGVRRIEAVTGTGALAWVRDTDARLARVASALKSDRDAVDAKVDQLLARSRDLEKEVERLKGKLAASAGDDLADRAVDVNGLKVLAAKLDGADPKSLRDTVDQLKNKLGSAAVVLATVNDGKVAPGGRCDQGLDRSPGGGAPGQPRGPAGGRARRRSSGHGPGRRQRSDSHRQGHRFGARLGARPAWRLSRRLRPSTSFIAADLGPWHSSFRNSAAPRWRTRSASPG